MAKHSKLSLLGATLVTPMLTAGTAPASAMMPPTNVQKTNSPADRESTALETRLKAEILALSPSQKLQIAGHRVPLLKERARSLAKAVATTDSQVCMCDKHTNSNAGAGRALTPPYHGAVRNPVATAATGNTVKPVPGAAAGHQAQPALTSPKGTAPTP